MILRINKECLKLIVLTVYLSHGSCLETKIQKYCTSDIYKQIALILSCLNGSTQGRRGSYIQAKALYLSLRTSKGLNTRQICSSRRHKQNKHCQV